MAVSLKRQHGVDHMLEGTRARKAALFRHVADKNGGHCPSLGFGNQAMRAMTHLTHSSGG